VSVGLLIENAWPYVTMLTSAFLSATLLPFASEAALMGQIKGGYGSVFGLLAAATIGNVGGSTLNWWMGSMLLRFQNRPWFPFKADDIARASERFRRFGTWVLLLSWVPIIGDPLTLVAGVLRVPLSVFLALVTIGKACRYAVVASLS
jgi:membrane protein YqaA with SNARE-associated domain